MKESLVREQYAKNTYRSHEAQEQNSVDYKLVHAESLATCSNPSTSAVITIAWFVISVDVNIITASDSVTDANNCFNINIFNHPSSLEPKM